MKENLNLMGMTIERKRRAYSNFSTVCRVLNDFSLNENAETTTQLKNVIKCINGGMPLPSGRYGNPLAVALEMQYYTGALFIIKNAVDLEIDLESVSSEYDGRNVWNAEQTFELSQMGFENTKLASDDEAYKDFPMLIQSHNNNIDAAAEISDILANNIKTVCFFYNK